MSMLGAIIILIGAFFLLLAAIGLFRMPDIYNRIQTGTKASTLGTILFLIGMSISYIEYTYITKIIILILFIIFTNPISSHALARAAHFMGIPLTKKTIKDCLAEDGEH